MRTKRFTIVGRRTTEDVRGFTTIELLIVVFISLVVAAMAVPGYMNIARYLRVAGDARDLNGLTAEAKMRAAQDFTHARIRANLNTNTFQLEVWDKAANGGTGCWKTEGDSANPCTVAGSAVQPLSAGVIFGFTGASAGFPNPQTIIMQAPACGVGVAGGTAGGVIEGTACIEFNSRGIPVAASGAPTANDALYVTDTNNVYGVTVLASGLMQQWMTSTSNTAWQAR